MAAGGRVPAERLERDVRVACRGPVSTGSSEAAYGADGPAGHREGAENRASR